MSLPKPYYEQGGITIYHGDCREILPQLGPVDLVLTDPPYGINYSPAGGGAGWASKTFSGEHLVLGDAEPFDPTHLLGSPRLILWGGNHFADRLPASATWLIWYKRFPNEAPNDFADCELAWSNLGGPARVYWHEWKGAMRSSERAQHYHPTQKPVALMKWCLQQAGDSGVVLDPYMGSGPVARAAKDLKWRYIGIEIEEKYCRIAVERLQQEPLPLYVPAPRRSEATAPRGLPSQDDWRGGVIEEK